MITITISCVLTFLLLWVRRNAKKSEDKIQSLESEIAGVEEKMKELNSERESLEDEAKEALDKEQSAEVMSD